MVQLFAGELLINDGETLAIAIIFQLRSLVLDESELCQMFVIFQEEVFIPVL